MDYLPAISWGTLFEPKQVHSSTPAMLIVLLLFALPSGNPFRTNKDEDDGRKRLSSTKGLITWDEVKAGMPWEVLFLLGGGFALSKGKGRSSIK